MKTLLISILSLATVLGLSAPTFAHGGQYTGPRDVVPPSPGGPGGSPRPSGPKAPTTGRPGQPGAPIPAGGSIPGTTGGRGGLPGGVTPGPRTGPRGLPIVDDLTTWEYWWEFNKNPYLRLKEAVHRGAVQTGSDDFYLGGTRRTDATDLLKPSEGQIRFEILPALQGALDEALDRDADIVSAAMVALAKIGRDYPEIRLVDTFASRLDAHNQETRETAALALGIAGESADLGRQLDLLTGLALDAPLGREASGGREVRERTRAFAAFGLGLISWHTANLAIKERAFTALDRILHDDRLSSRNLAVAAIHGMSLLNLERGAQDHRQLCRRAVQSLERYYSAPLSPSARLIAAHCPTAIAKLLGREHRDAEYYRVLFAADLRGEHKRRRKANDLSRSCAMALGQLCPPNDDGTGAAAAYSQLLLDTWHEHRDQQTRYFAVLALGQIGGEANRITLQKEFHRSKQLSAPWVALALGVQAHALHAADDANRSATATIGDTLHGAFLEAKTPQLLSAYAVALGLCRHTEAASDLRRALHKHEAQQDVAGYLCIGLALMRDNDSRERITEVMLASTRKPRLVQQAAMALGVLGDKSAARLLSEQLADGQQNLARLAAIASSLGFIGDAGSISRLTSMLQDNDLSQLSRAFCAVALGGIADKELMPWNSKLAIHTNYRAATETLTNESSGILDIL